MPFFVYVLRSTQTDRLYVGQSSDPWRRLAEHNSGKSLSTRAYAPWELVYSEEFDTRAQAVRREREIKSWKSRTAIQQLIGQS